MSERRSSGRPDAFGEPIPDETLERYVSLRCQLAAQMAEANFRTITATPAWTMVDVETETDRAIERLEITARDMLAGKGADPSGENWQAIWTAIEASYRETMGGLLKASGRRGGGTLQ